MDPNSLMFISIITYLFMAVIMLQLGLKSAYLTRNIPIGSKPKAYNNVYLFWALLFFALMCGLRYRCGADCESYVAGLDRVAAGQPLPLYGESVEPLFEYTTRFMVWLGIGRVPYLGFWALVEISFFYSALRTRNFLLPFVGLVLILGPHFCSWNNGIRQVTSSCIFVYALVGILEGKKLWTYFVWIAVAFFIHKSSLLLVPLVLLKYYNVKPKVLFSAIILLACVYIGQTGVLDFAFDGIELLLSFMEYDDYAKNVDSIMDAEATIQSYGPRRILLLASYLMIIFFCKKMDVFYKHDRLLRVSFLLFMIYACATELVIGHTTLLTRPFLFFMPFLLICSGYLLNYLKKTKKVRWYGVSLVIFCSYIVMASFAEYKDSEETTLYKFIFLK